MITQISIRSGLHRKHISFNGEKTVRALLDDPATAVQIGASENADVLVNGGSVDQSSYVLQNGDELIVEAKSTEKN